MASHTHQKSNLELPGVTTGQRMKILFIEYTHTDNAHISDDFLVCSFDIMYQNDHKSPNFYSEGHFLVMRSSQKWIIIRPTQMDETAHNFLTIGLHVLSNVLGHYRRQKNRTTKSQVSSFFRAENETTP